MDDEISVFGGQGIPSGQLAELRKIVNEPAVATFVKQLSQSITDCVRRIPENLHVARVKHLAHGLDIAMWSTGPANSPSLDYLGNLPVTLVLTFVVQLATFKYCRFKKDSGYSPPPRTSGTTILPYAAAGHSQGMAAAMVVALSADEESFAKYAATFADVLLCFGLVAAKHIDAKHETSPPLLKGPAAPAAPAAPLPQFALAVVKVPVEKVADAVAEYSKAVDLPASRVHLVVLNGAEACMITGAPAALAAFQIYIREWISNTSLPSCTAMKLHALPVRAPFHCGEWLAAASAECSALLACRQSPISTAALMRPFWSCVDGAMFAPTAHSCVSAKAGTAESPPQLPNMQNFLVEALAVKPVDWPATLQAVADHARVRDVAARVALVALDHHGTSAAAAAAAAAAEGASNNGAPAPYNASGSGSGSGSGDGGGGGNVAARAPMAFVDYGPGGGSGAARMSSVIVGERDLADAVDPSYFTQRHCVPGKLPQSWLKWLKTVDAAAAATKDCNAATARPKVPLSTTKKRNTGAGTVVVAKAGTASVAKAGRKFVWFSDRVKQASGGGAVIEFTDELMAAIAIELEKANVGRKAAIASAVYVPPIKAMLETSKEYAALRQQQTRAYDISKYPFQTCFAKLLALPDGVQMHQLHERFNGDRGSKRDRREKRLLLSPLTDAEARAPFEQLYEAFVLEVLAPLVSESMGCSAVVFQSFPCVRVHRPAEFSIGPHCDAQYQLPNGYLNIWLPLTPAADANSIYLESEPGKEDFKPLNLQYGELVTFYGAFCTHFAVENTTADTRVSLDFRVAPGNLYDEGAAKGLADPKTNKCALGSYFSECARNGDGTFAVTTRGYPNHRHGFPHTNR